MNICAVAGVASIGIRCAPAEVFGAHRKPQGISADGRPLASASYSRDREIAIWISAAARGARIIIAIAADQAAVSFLFVAPPAKTAEDHRPLRHMWQHADGAGECCGDRADQNVAIANVTEFVRHHALEFVPGEQLQDSLGRRNGSMLRIRPVAKAFGASEGMTYTFGIGIFIFSARSCVTAHSIGASASVASRALYIRNTILSLNQ